MLLRSSSTPIAKTWIPLTKDFTPERDLIPPLQRARSKSYVSSFMSITASHNSPPSSEESSWGLSRKLPRALSETDLRNLAVPKQQPFAQSPNLLPSISMEEREEEKATDAASSSLLFSSSGLSESLKDEEGCSVVAGTGTEERSPATLFSGHGFGSVGGGGAICGGRGEGSNGGDEDGSSGFSNSDHGKNSTDAYYQKMIEADPGNALLLSNYSMFLKEVRGDLVKAEEYYGRAILANPGDGHVLSLYADLIWESQKDAERAEGYFDQAIKAAPDDCHVMASYARFLWDVEGEETQEENVTKTITSFPGATDLPLPAAETDKPKETPRPPSLSPSTLTL